MYYHSDNMNFEIIIHVHVALHADEAELLIYSSSRTTDTLQKWGALIIV